MQPAPEKSEVVYRKTPASATTNAERGRGYAPAIVPLVTGFLLLLVVILVLGVKSASKMNDVASNARILTLGYSTHLTTLLDLRLKVFNLNNEARLRDAAEARRELTPPLDVRLDTARADVKAQYQSLGTTTPIDVKPELWAKFKTDLEAYIEVTQDPRQFSLKGFDKYKPLQDDLSELITAARERYDHVGQNCTISELSESNNPQVECICGSGRCASCSRNYLASTATLQSDAPEHVGDPAGTHFHNSTPTGHGQRRRCH